MVSLVDIVVISFAFFALSRAILRYKDKRINFKELTFWGAFWILVVIAVFLKKKLQFLTDLGIARRPIDVLTVISIIALFYLLFRLYISIDELNQGLTKLVRQVALQENRTRTIIPHTEQKTQQKREAIKNRDD